MAKDNHTQAFFEVVDTIHKLGGKVTAAHSLGGNGELRVYHMGPRVLLLQEFPDDGGVELCVPLTESGNRQDMLHKLCQYAGVGSAQ